MKKTVLVIFTFLLLCCLASCTPANSKTVTEKSDLSTPEDTEIMTSSSENNSITVIINNKEFKAKLNGSKASEELLKRLPLKIVMNELNNNEKYYRFDSAFPTDDREISNIEIGDLMIYNDNYLVLFYDNFKTSYRYTPIGKIENTSGLAQALGENEVEVLFNKTN